MATGGILTKGSTPREAQFDRETLIEIDALACQRGYPGAAHGDGTVGIRYVADAGVSTIERCAWVGENGLGGDYDAGLAADLDSLSAVVAVRITG